MNERTEQAVDQELFAYCREVETYLCRKNDGHLIRIVGPAFDQVCGWSRMGVPLKVVFSGIDRYVERYYAKRPRRRPVRIEFCEADVLDVFDEWRRAVGVALVRDKSGTDPSKRASLHAHINRAIVKLTTVEVGTASATAPGPSFGGTVQRVLAELNDIARMSKGSRGEARAQIVAGLSRLDDELLDAAFAALDSVTLTELQDTAARDLAPFAPRMDAGQHQRAVAAARNRLIRERIGLPVLSYVE